MKVSMCRLVTGEYVMGEMLPTLTEDLGPAILFKNAFMLYPETKETEAGTMIGFKGGEAFWQMECSVGSPFQTFTLLRSQILGEPYPCQEKQVVDRYVQALTAAMMIVPEEKSSIIIQ